MIEKAPIGQVEVSELTVSKVPAIGVLFWVIKIAATTLGETGGDAVSMSMNLGYLVSSAIFGVIFVSAVIAQIAARRFHPSLYWFTIIATTTLGTTLADFADRSLGIGYAGGASTLLALLLLSLFVWYRTLGSIAVSSICTPKAEWFYWITILLSQTLGTALGDWTADTEGLGFTGGVVLFVSFLSVCAGAYYWSRVSRTVLFWAAFILTRPLGAVVGDLLDKPLSSGGFSLSRYTVSALLIAFIIVCLWVFRSELRAPLIDRIVVDANPLLSGRGPAPPAFLLSRAHAHSRLVEFEHRNTQRSLVRWR